VQDREVSNGIKPHFVFKCDYLDMLVMSVCKSGWYGGNPSLAYQAPIDEVFNAFHFDNACKDYEHTYYELNKGKKQ
jgi:hypothetical protein